jgi:hypothetical protein
VFLDLSNPTPGEKQPGDAVPALLPPLTSDLVQPIVLQSPACSWTFQAHHIWWNGYQGFFFDDLAYSIGQDVYADLNGWHLFLKDMSKWPF